MYDHLLELDYQSRLTIQQDIKNFIKIHSEGTECAPRTFKTREDSEKAIQILNDMISDTGRCIQEELVSSSVRAPDDIFISLKFEDTNNNKKGSNLDISFVYAYRTTEQMPLSDYILLSKIILMTIEKKD